MFDWERGLSHIALEKSDRPESFYELRKAVGTTALPVETAPALRAGANLTPDRQYSDH